MILNLGKVKPGSTLYIPFDTFAGSTGASITASGLAVTDIEIYKNGSTTQRSSDTGYSLLDTDGLDFDGVTGIHGFSIDLSSNADSGFFVAGGSYRVVVSTITVDGQTLSFTAAVFEIGYEGALLDTTIASLSSQTSFTLTAGPAEDNALNGCLVLIHDIASAVQMGYAVIEVYTGASKTVTLKAGVSFTAAAGDNISIFPPSLQPTTWGRTLDVASTGEAEADMVKISGDEAAANNLETMLDGTGGQQFTIGALSIVNTSNSRPAVNIETSAAVTSYPAINIYSDQDAALTLVNGVTSQDVVRIVAGGAGGGVSVFGDVFANLVGNITGDLFGFIDGISGTLETFDDLWTKIRKFFQLLLRGDAAIATDNATELTEINNDEGSGPGTYDNTTDSLEAIQISLVAPELSIVTGTVANADTTSIDLGTLTFGDDEPNNLLIRVYDNSAGEYHSRWVDDYVGATSIATLSAALPFTTESGVDTFVVYAIRRDVTASIGAADIRAAVGLASANLDTQLGAIDDFLDTEVAAIKAKTDNLPSDPADASDIATSFSTVNSKLDTIDDFLDTEVAAIKAKTDNLPTDPADASDIAASFALVNSTLSTIAAYIDTEITTLLSRVPDTLSLANINAEMVDVVGTDIIPDSVATDGSQPTMRQALLMIARFLMEKEVVGTTVTVKKEDGTTASMTFTLDAAVSPTSITRAT